jgi:hypothetical protein
MAIVFTNPIEQFPVHLAFTTLPVVTNVDAAYPAKNLLTYDPTNVTRTTTGSSVITWDFGMLRNFNVVSLVRCNVSARATLKIEASTDNSNWALLRAVAPFWANLTATPAAGPYAEDLDPRRGSLERNSSWYYSATTLNYRYLRLTVADPEVSTMSFGRLFVGRAFVPATGYQYGSRISFDDSGNTDRTDQGALVMQAGRSIVSANVKMDFVSSAEMYDYVYEFNYWRQSARELLVCLDTDTVPRMQKNLLYARLAEGRQVSADNFNAWSQAWTLESI